MVIIKGKYMYLAQYSCTVTKIRKSYTKLEFVTFQNSPFGYVEQTEKLLKLRSLGNNNPFKH